MYIILITELFGVSNYSVSLSDSLMDFDDGCCFLENNFDQFYWTDLLSPNDSRISVNDTTQQSSDQVFFIYLIRLTAN